MKNDIQFFVVLVILLTIVAMLWHDKKHPTVTDSQGNSWVTMEEKQQ
jgi:hypothetical protein